MPTNLSSNAAAVCSLAFTRGLKDRKPLLQHKDLIQSRKEGGKEVTPQTARSLSAINTFLLSQVSNKTTGLRS